MLVVQCHMGVTEGCESWATMKLHAYLHRLLRDTGGATAVEYGLLVAMLVVGSMVGYQALSNANISTWMNVASRVMAAASAARGS